MYTCSQCEYWSDDRIDITDDGTFKKICVNLNSRRCYQFTTPGDGCDQFQPKEQALGPR